MAGFPTTDEFQHQFLGLVSPSCPNGAHNPAYDDVEVNGTPDGRVAQREAFIRRAYKGADATLTPARALAGGNPTTFISSDHGFGPQFLAVDASKLLVKLGLLPDAADVELPPGPGETIGKAKACWAGGALQIYLNLAGRDPAERVLAGGAADQTTTVNQIRAAYQNLVDPNDWTGDGKPEGWKVIDRTSQRPRRGTSRTARSTADMAHPTRTGDLVVFAYPPYQFDAATPGTLIARSQFFGQHGYVPDVQNLASEHQHAGDVPRRRPGIAMAIPDVRSIDLAPTLAYILGVPGPSRARARSCPRSSRAATRQADLDRRPHRLPRPARAVDLNRATARSTCPSVARRTWRRCSTRSPRPCPGPGCWWRRATTSARRRRTRACSRTSLHRRRERVGPDATSSATTSSTTAWTRLHHIANAHFPFLATNSSRRRPATSRLPPAVQGLHVNGIQVGVIGAELEVTPELVSANATAGLTFLDEATRIHSESQRLEPSA